MLKGHHIQNYHVDGVINIFIAVKLVTSWVSLLKAMVCLNATNSIQKI